MTCYTQQDTTQTKTSDSSLFHWWINFGIGTGDYPFAGNASVDFQYKNFLIELHSVGVSELFGYGVEDVGLLAGVVAEKERWHFALTAGYAWMTYRHTSIFGGTTTPSEGSGMVAEAQIFYRILKWLGAGVCGNVLFANDATHYLGTISLQLGQLF